MRLFVAAEIGPEPAGAAGVLIHELRARAGRLAPNAKITWVAPDRLHVTMAFIGDADETRTRMIASVLEPSLDVAAFPLTIAGVHTFPKTGKPRVIWAGLTTGREELIEVERVVSSRLAAAGIVAEPRAFNPHLTLARVRDAAGLRAAALLSGLSTDIIGTTTVEAITLFDSRLSSKGPTYVPLLRTALRQTGG